MTADTIGTNSWGEPVFWDKNAFEADAVVTVSLSSCTDFRGRFEIGIVKMLVIGLGKRDGASQHHRWGAHDLREYAAGNCESRVGRLPFRRASPSWKMLRNRRHVSRCLIATNCSLWNLAYLKRRNA